MTRHFGVFCDVYFCDKCKKKTVAYIHLNGDMQWLIHRKTTKIKKNVDYPSWHRLCVNAHDSCCSKCNL